MVIQWAGERPGGEIFMKKAIPPQKSHKKALI
jgi:hypothetical protein